MVAGETRCGTGEGRPDAPGVLDLGGDVTIGTVSLLRDRIGMPSADRPWAVDLAGVHRLDTAGAWFLTDLRRRLTAAGGSLEIRNASAEAQLLLQHVSLALPAEPPPATRRGGPAALLESLGRGVSGGVAVLLDLIGFLGLFVASLARLLRHPGRFRMTALVAQCEEVGLRAVPIVALMSFLIGVVLAFQGSAQLRAFGAEVFVVDLIAISILRELGILLTAIIVAGRTASAFTAAIGSMKMREEIDAMRTLGLDPSIVLVVPRILALLIMLPILGLIADLSGLVGGALMAWIDLGISPGMFRVRLGEGTDVSHVLAGLAKAPAFAVIIGLVGCHAGMRVGGDAESLGRMTSNAVVTAIFAVIVADALFSVLFARVGI